MQKKFLTNLVLLLFLNFLIKPFYIFGIDRTVQNTVGNVNYGFYFTIFNLAFVFSIILDAGITSFNNRNIAQHVHLLNKHFSSLVILRFLLTFVYIAVIFIVALVLGYKGQQLTMLAWVGFNQFLLSFILYLRSNVSGLLMFRTDSFLSVLDRLLMILICGVLLWGNLMGSVFKIEWFVYSQTAAYAITTLVALAIVMKKAKFQRLSWNWPFFLVILKKSFPFALLSLFMLFYSRLDTVFIERLLKGAEGSRQVGIYAQSYRLLDALNQFAWLFAVLLLPIYSRMIKMKQELNKMVKFPYALLVTSGIVIVTGSFFYRTEIMGWLYPQEALETAASYSNKLSQSSDVFGILMFGFLGSTTMYIFSTLLTANGNLKQLNLIAAGGIIINFVFNLILIPRMQASGAAYASLLTQIFTAGSYMFMAQYFFRFKIDYRFIFTLLLFILMVIGFNFVSRELSFHWLVRFSIMLVTSMLAAFALRLVNILEIIRLLKEKATV